MLCDSLYAKFLTQLCAPVGRASDSVMASTWSYSFLSVGAGASCLLLGSPGFSWCFSFAPDFQCYWAPRGLRRQVAYLVCEFSFLIHHGGYHDLFVVP